MKRTLAIHILAIMSMVILLACGRDSTSSTMDAGGSDAAAGGSGLAASKRVVDLSSPEVSQLCSWAIMAAGGAGVVVSCPDGDVTTQTVADCEASVGSVPASCEATVGELEACMEAIGADPCVVYTAPACQILIACASGTP